jgi:hypothetical protein
MSAELGRIRGSVEFERRRSELLADERKRRRIVILPSQGGKTATIVRESPGPIFSTEAESKVSRRSVVARRSIEFRKGVK